MENIVPFRPGAWRNPEDPPHPIERSPVLSSMRKAGQGIWLTDQSIPLSVVVRHSTAVSISIIGRSPTAQAAGPRALRQGSRQLQLAVIRLPCLLESSPAVLRAKLPQSILSSPSNDRVTDRAQRSLRDGAVREIPGSLSRIPETSRVFSMLSRHGGGTAGPHPACLAKNMRWQKETGCGQKG